MPKYLKVAEELEARLGAGGGDEHKLPSVRKIADEYAVSIVTASRAVQILRDKGLIETVDRSGCYVIPEARKATEHWALFMRLTPEPWQQATGSITLSGFHAAARREGFHLHADAIKFLEPMSERAWITQIRAARDTGIRGVVFLPSRRNAKQCRQDEQFLKLCRRERFPVVLLDRNLRGHYRPLEHDLISIDDVLAGQELTCHLFKAGRQRIAFVTGSPISSHDRRVAGFLLAHQFLQEDSEYRKDRQPIVLYQDGDQPARPAFRQLVNDILECKADGVICYEDYVAVALIMELLARKIDVPGEIAVAGFDNLPIGTTFSIGVTTYDYPAEAIARNAIGLLRTRLQQPDRSPVHVMVRGELIARESSGGNS